MGAAPPILSLTHVALWARWGVRSSAASFAMPSVPLALAESPSCDQGLASDWSGPNRELARSDIRLRPLPLRQHRLGRDGGAAGRKRTRSPRALRAPSVVEAGLD